jgi:hypothetical protein
MDVAAITRKIADNVAPMLVSNGIAVSTEYILEGLDNAKK